MSLNFAVSAATSAVQSLAAQRPGSPSFDLAALNPQPLPPRDGGPSTSLGRFDAAALNPQPLPPRESPLDSLLQRLDSLNPQPLPPREGLSLSSRIGTLLDDFCGTVPRKLPPPPPPPVGSLLG